VAVEILESEQAVTAAEIRINESVTGAVRMVILQTTVLLDRVGPVQVRNGVQVCNGTRNLETENVGFSIN
jgi:hypothetical protein